MWKREQKECPGQKTERRLKNSAVVRTSHRLAAMFWNLTVTLEESIMTRDALPPLATNRP